MLYSKWAALSVPKLFCKRERLCESLVNARDAVQSVDHFCCVGLMSKE